MFNHWADNASTTAVRSIAPPDFGNATYTSVYDKQYNLITTPNDTSGGLISLDKVGPWYTTSTVVKLTATPTTGWVFKNWQIQCTNGTLCGTTSTTNPLNVTMDSPKTITAVFAQRVTIATSPAGYGYSVNGTGYATATTFDMYPGQNYIVSVTTPTVNISAYERYVFSGWSNGVSAVGQTISIPSTYATYTANYPHYYQMGVYKIPGSTGGTVELYKTGNVLYQTITGALFEDWMVAGTSVKVKAIPDAGYNFDNWSGDISSTMIETPYFTISKAGYGIWATFSLKKYAISTVASNGTVVCTPNPVDHGTISTCAVTPDAGYHIATVSGCGGSLSGNSFTTGTITDVCTITATFANSAPATPVANSPALNSEVTTTMPTLAVNISSDPDGDVVTYNYEVYSDSGLTTLVTSTTNQGTSWLVSTPLNDNIAYFWRVQSTDGHMNSNWMATANFFINTANDAPTDPGISSPANNSHVPSLTPTLSVTNAVDLDKNDTVTYDFDVASDGGFSNIVASVVSKSAGTGGTTSWAITSALSEDAPYYWRSRAVDNHGAASNWVGASFFVNATNNAPTAPVLGSPTNSSEVTNIAPTLVVTNSTDIDHDTLSYTFEIDTVNTFNSAGKQTSGLTAEGAGTTNWSPAALADNTTYYWRAKANDGLADSPWMTTGQFFVNIANDAPSVPTLSNPANNSQVTVLAPTLSVNAATDIDNDSITYEYEVYSDSGLTSKVTGTIGATTSWTLSTALSDNTNYYWRARAVDVHGLAGGWLATSSFFVNNNGTNDPPTITVTAPAATMDITGTSTVNITWTAADPDSDPIITLYYDTTGSGHNGTQIVTGLHKSDPTSSYAWSITSLQDGTYYVYAKIDDGTTINYAYAPGHLVKQTRSGDLNGDHVIDTSDALRALRIAAGLVAPTANDLAYGDVAPIVNGVPQPDGRIDIGDVVVILRRAVGLITW